LLRINRTRGKRECGARKRLARAPAASGRSENLRAA
jgi:hypothetical protein